MFDNHTILLFWLKNKQTFRMFSLRDLRFVLCSRDLDVLRAQRIMGFFDLITHKSTRSENAITCLRFLTYDMKDSKRVIHYVGSHVH